MRILNVQQNSTIQFCDSITKTCNVNQIFVHGHQTVNKQIKSSEYQIKMGHQQCFEYATRSTPYMMWKRVVHIQYECMTNTVNLWLCDKELDHETLCVVGGGHMRNQQLNVPLTFRKLNVTRWCLYDSVQYSLENVP